MTRQSVGNKYKDYIEFQECVSDMNIQSIKGNGLLNICAGVDVFLGSNKKSYCDVVIVIVIDMVTNTDTCTAISTPDS